MADVNKQPKGPKAQAAPKQGGQPKPAAAAAASPAKAAPVASPSKAAAAAPAAPKKAAVVRSRFLARGLNRFSTSKMFHNAGRFWFAQHPTAKKAKTPESKTISKKVGGKGNGTERTVPRRSRSTYYPTEDIPRPLPSNKGHNSTKNGTQLRANIAPGQVLIVLAGPFRGKRVVFLKQLPSGLLLVTGPFKINGVPLRRINQAYVLATSTRVDVSSVDVSNAELVDKTFARPKKVVEKKSEDQYFNKGNQKKASVDASRVALQKTVDAPLLKNIKAVPLLEPYLSSRFSLKHGQYPHLMQF
jgi:large subunit ribosomal protein L6e